MRFNKTKLLLWALFILLSILIASIGLRVELSAEVYEKVYFVGLICGGISLLCFLFGVFYFVKKNSSVSFYKKREKFKKFFAKAEQFPQKYINRLKGKNLLFNLYYVFISVIGFAFFSLTSFCFFVKPILLLGFPCIMATVSPIWRLLEYFLRKDQIDYVSGDISKEEYPQTFEFFENVVKENLGDRYTLKIDLSSSELITAKLVGKILRINLNSYSFMLLTKEEIKATLIRALNTLKDKTCKGLIKLKKSRNIYSGGVPIGPLFSIYFSFIVYDTLLEFDIFGHFLDCQFEKRADLLIKDTPFAKDYLRAYKKNEVLNNYFHDGRSFIILKLCENDNLKDFAFVIFSHFIDLLPNFSKEWEQNVERKLKAEIPLQLTYSEKCGSLGISVDCGEFKDNSSPEEKVIYDKSNAEYYRGAKLAHDAKKQSIEGFYAEIYHYEQSPESYDERLKLINIAHAYYTVNQLDKAEEIYSRIIQEDSTPETLYDYGCFLLLAKNDRRGIDYIYKAMKNENLVEDGLIVLGRYFVNAGDKEGYEKYSEYKNNRLAELEKGAKDRVINIKVEFKKSKIDKDLLSEIVDKLSKDDNLTEIYCADSKTKSGKDIIVFGIAVRNKTQESFINSYERVFSILDNDYGKYDTFLIAVDSPRDKVLTKKMKKDEKFKVFTRL